MPLNHALIACQRPPVFLASFVFAEKSATEKLHCHGDSLLEYTLWYQNVGVQPQFDMKCLGQRS